MTDKIVVITTVSTKEEADRIAAKLIEDQLAACVTVFPGAESVYRWKGQIERASELLLLIKSRRDLMPKLSEALQSIHSYETPEVLAVPVVDGSAAYLEWLDHQLLS